MRDGAVTVQPTGELTANYELDVVPAKPPPKVLANRASKTGGCPLALRAVVEAEPKENSLAIADIDGSKMTLRPRQRIRVASRSYTIEEIANMHVVLRDGTHRIRCDVVVEN